MSNLSWRVKLMALFTVVLGASLLFQLFYVIPYVRNREVEMTQRDQREIARSIALELEIDLLRVKDMLTRIAKRAEFRNMDITAQQKTMAQHAEVSLLFTSLFVMDAEGWFVSSSVDDLSPYRERSFADRPFFTVPFEEGEVYFAPPEFYPEMGFVGASVSVPIETGTGERVGVLTGGMRLNELIENVANYPLGEDTVACVVDKEGTVVAHSGIDLFALEEGPLSLDYSNWPMVQCVMAGQMCERAKYEHDGMSYFGACAILESNGWGAVVGASTSSILAESDRLARRLLLANIALFPIALAVSLVFTRQITVERKQAEEALRESETLYHALFEHNPIETVVVDLEGRVTGFNSAKRNSGDRLPQIGDVMYRDYAGKHEIDMYAELMACIRSGELREYPERQYGDKFLSIKIAPFPKGAIITSQDITERKRADEALQAASRMEAVATLAGGIAHKFNNLMAVVLGNASIVREELGDAHPRATALRQVEETAQSAAKLVRQMLAFARAGKYQPTVLNLNDIIEETLRLGELAFPRGVHMECELWPKLWSVEAELGQLSEVFTNLCLNAVEAIEGDGVVRISTRNVDVDGAFARAHPGLSPGRYVCLSVEDTGRGMSAETVSRVFEPFFTTKFQGRGLGLATVYGIVKHHGGHVAVDSQEGRGTTFRVYLPASKVEPEGPFKSRGILRRGTETILVVDDEDMILEVTRMALGALGYQVLLARNGQEAVGIARNFDGDIHLVLLDMVMPGMGGAQAYPLLMEARPNVKVLIISGHELDSSVQALLDAGADGFLAKPLSPKELAQEIRSALDS